MTPFARFLLFMLFLVPAAYMGASYYNGEDSIQTIKETLGIETSAGDSYSETSSASEANYDLRSENEELRARVKELEKENSKLKEEVAYLKMQQ